MASQWIFQSINAKATELNKEFVPGASIFFVSTFFDPVPDPSGKIDNSSFNLVNGNDILLHISTRREQGQIVLDTRRGDHWDSKLEVIDLKGVFPGPGAIVRINATATSYEISFNNSPTIHTFAKRINANATAVSYGLNEKQRAVYSNPVVVQVYENGMFFKSLRFPPPPPPFTRPRLVWTNFLTSLALASKRHCGWTSHCIRLRIKPRPSQSVRDPSSVSAVLDYFSNLGPLVGHCCLSCA